MTDAVFPTDVSAPAQAPLRAPAPLRPKSKPAGQSRRAKARGAQPALAAAPKLRARPAPQPRPNETPPRRAPAADTPSPGKTKMTQTAPTRSRKSAAARAAGGFSTLSDDALLDLVQRRTFRYFWDYAHPVSGLIRERRSPGDLDSDFVATGATGFGVMAIVVAVERGWVGRGEAVARLLQMIGHLERAQCFHGVLPHWFNGRTGQTIHFSRKDDGADLVETAFLMQGLLTARQYFDGPGREAELRERSDRLWRETEWVWHTREGRDVLYWHWSPNHGWAMNFPIIGWNEAMITYVLAASSPTFPIEPSVYHKGWAGGRTFRNGKSFYDIELPLGPDYGGPLAFAQYSFQGLDPRGLVDDYADYWAQNVAQTRIQVEYAIRNPKGFKGYGANCWGWTAEDTDTGYGELSPTTDLGVIAPTGAIGCLPYTPEASMRALRHFVGPLGDKIFGEFGFVSGFCEQRDWWSRDYIGIDQGPIVTMIENFRTGLLWRLFMSAPEIGVGLKRLGFRSPATAQPNVARQDAAREDAARHNGAREGAPA